MRVKLGWVLLGLGIAVVVGCGAGKESEKKGHVDLGEAGTTGTTGGDSSSGGGASGSDSGGPTNGGASGGDGGGPTNGGASGGDGGVSTNGGAFVAGAAGSQAAAAVPVGEPCTTDDTCGDSGICYVGPGGPFGSCRIACDWEATGERDACAADELCVTASGGVTAGCLRTCDPYAESSVCDAGDWCIPEPSASYTGGDPADGLCVTRGESTAGDGEPCVAGSCAAGLLC